MRGWDLEWEGRAVVVTGTKFCLLWIKVQTLFFFCSI